MLAGLWVGTKVMLRGTPVEDRPSNDLLRRLSDQDYELLAPFLERVDLPSNEVLFHPGEDVQTVFFPCETSAASFTVTIEDGRDVQTVLVGHEGAVGGIISHGFSPAFSRIVVLFGGPFVQMPIRQLELAQAQSRSLNHLFARYADCVLAQCFQSIACNAVHTIEQRAAKWLVAAMRRVKTNMIPVNHEHFALMLGVGRSYASRIILEFKAERILDTRRGTLIILDEAALERKSCACNDAVDSHFRDVLQGVYFDRS